MKHEKTKNKKMKKETIIKIIFIIYICILCSTWAVSMGHDNVMGPPDERMKYDICNYIFKNKSLPHGGDEAVRDEIWGISYGFNPILSYIFSAIFMLVTSLFTSDPNIIFLSSRFVSVICLSAFAFMNIKISKKLFKEKIYRWLYVIFVTLLPQVVFLGSYLNNDALALLSISIIVYSWLLGIEENWSYKSCIIMGIGIGLCALSYYNAYGYILFSVIMYFASCFIKKINIKELLKKGIIISLIAFIIAGWWFIRSYIIYDGDFLGMNTSKEYAELYAKEEYKPSNRLTPDKQKIGLVTMLIDREWIKNTLDSFIGMYGHMCIRMEEWAYLIYKILFIISISGLILEFIGSFVKKIQHRNKLKEQEEIIKKSKEKRLFEVIMIVNIIIPILLSIYYSYCSDFQPQGRYIMPIIIPFIYFIVKGIKYILKQFVKKKEIKNIILICLMSLWLIMPIIIYFRYIKS